LIAANGSSTRNCIVVRPAEQARQMVNSAVSGTMAQALAFIKSMFPCR
jgi:hypothetical protein